MGKTAAASVAKLAPPTLPEASPAGLAGMPVTPAPPGPGGQTGFTLSLPISPGRGYAPPMALSSGGGNGVFGLGWHAGAPSIRRRTDRGVPSYETPDPDTNRDPDTYIGPNGDILVPQDGDPIAVKISLNESYTVTRYFPRVEGTFERIEHWYGRPAQGSPPKDFWLVHDPDGSLLCLGKSADARIADPVNPLHVVEWLAEESVSADGQHIYYRYANSDATGAKAAPGYDIGSNRYLTCICYGNVTANADLFLWESDTAPANQAWLFTLLFDYGTPTASGTKPAAFDTFNMAPWPERSDPFSHYDAGFEVRTQFLCRQVLMFHRFPDGLDTDASLVNRLRLEYEETPACSRLIGVQLMAYETDDTVQELAPLDIDWSPDFEPPVSPDWQELEQPLTSHVDGAPPDYDPMTYHQTDLYSEGMSGLLYQEGSRWYYRRPVRDQRSGVTADAITYGPRELLPAVPTLQGGASASLMDVNGDGQLEWLVTSPGTASGYYSMQPDRKWSAFTPLTQLPLEVLQPYAMYADVRGAGLSDLVVLGPTSVRYYANRSTYAQVSFDPPKDVAQADGVVLPMPGRNPLEWVGFADVLGSGQSHLVSVRPDTDTVTVTCWPWLGNGLFGTELVLTKGLPFTRNTFDPRRVFLVSLYGPGAPDLVYADVSNLKVFRNLAGNRIDTTPVPISYPSGVHMGSLTQISFSDLAGRGTTSALLTQNFGGPDNAVRHWRLDFYPSSPPYQLSAVDNNTGARCDLTWRSSIQDWVDEKVQEPESPSGLPSSSMVLGSIARQDAITGQQLVTTATYRRGVWDGHERESRGYGYMETRESTTVIASGANADGTAPCITRSWYHTGQLNDTKPENLYKAPYTHFPDPYAFAQDETRLTIFSAAPTDANPWHDVEYADPTTNTQWWMQRSLKGSLLRNEQYDASQPLTSTSVPYAIQYNRWQVREVQSSSLTPVVLPMELEQLSYHYDQVAADPHITQTVAMDSDAYGYTLWAVDVAYPRRLSKTDENPYADLPWPASGNPGTSGAVVTEIPDNSWQATFDEQQTQGRLTEHRYDVSSSAVGTAPGTVATGWRLGILNASRQNTLVYEASAFVDGLTVESLGQLSDDTCLLAPQQTRKLQAQSVITYQANTPAYLKLVAQIDTALLTRSDVAMLDGSIPSTLITEGGYMPCDTVLSVPGLPSSEPQIWAGRFDIATYDTQANFWRPLSQQQTSLLEADLKPPKITYSWDPHHCVVTAATDAYGNTIAATAIDYRFLRPKQILDPNQNTHQIQQDALGRVVATTFFGTQLSTDGEVAQVGFGNLTTCPADVHQTVAEALNTYAPQQQATRTIYEGLSWMGNSVSNRLKTAAPDVPTGVMFAKLVELGFVTQAGRVHSRGRRWARSTAQLVEIPDSVRSILANEPGTPAHSATLIADSWPSSGASQAIRAAVAHVDGYGRVLRTATKVPDGLAFQRTDIGDLTPDASQSPPLAQTQASPRWAITDTVRYGPNGQGLNTWPPFFLNDWGFVNYDALPVPGYADTYYFDAFDREILVRTGLNEWRRTSYAPWFEIAEDENDLDELIADAQLTITDTDIELTGSRPAAATADQLPSMQRAVGSNFEDNTLVLDGQDGIIRIRWKPGFDPDKGVDKPTISFTDNRHLTGDIVVDTQLKTLKLSLQVRSDIFLSVTNGDPVDSAFPIYTTINITETETVLQYAYTRNEAPLEGNNAISGLLQPSRPEVFDNFPLDAIYLTIPVYNDSQFTTLRVCNQKFYNYSAYSKWLYDNADAAGPLDSTQWPYPTKYLQVTTFFQKIYTLVIALGGTEKSYWLATSDSSKSFTMSDYVAAVISADYTNQPTQLYTGIVCLDDTGQIVSESWRRAFFIAKI